jgi:hypothetical protein
VRRGNHYPGYGRRDEMALKREKLQVTGYPSQEETKGPRWRDGLGRLRAGTIFGLPLFAVALLVPSIASAARPLFTDDAGTVGKGKGAIELGGEISSWKDRVDGIKVRGRGTEVSGAFIYGISEKVDVVVRLPYDWGIVWEDGATVFKEKGFSDPCIDVKWRFYEKDGLGLDLKPGITLPAGNEEKGFGAGQVTYGLTFIASKEWESFTLHFNAGYGRNENRRDERKDLWSASLAVSREVAKGLKVVGDLGFERNADRAVNTAPAFALIGLSYGVNDHIFLDGGLKMGLNKQEADHAVIVGITVSF